MSATPASAKPRRLRTVALLAITGVVAVAIAFWRTPDQAWDDEVARLRADGFATSPAEWLGPPVPADLNGAAEIDAADAWLAEELGEPSAWTTIGPWTFDRDPWWADPTPEDIADLQALLVRAEPYFRRVAAAARKPHLRWGPGSSPLDWTAASVPRLIRLEQMSSAAARFSADPGRRLESVATGLRIAVRPDRPLDGVEAMVTQSCARTALADLRYCVELGTISAADAAQTLQEIPLPRFADRTADILRADIAAWASVDPEWFLAPLSRPLGYLKPDPGSGPIPVPLRHGAIVGMGMPPVPSSLLALTWHGPASLLRDFHTAADACGPKPSEVRAALRPFERPHDCNHHGDPIAGAVRTLRTSARLDASAGLTRIALAARLVRDANGRWPANLAEVGGDLPQDPFADAPFGYEIVGDSLRVTSRGAFAPDAPPTEENLSSDGLVWVLPAR